MILNYIYNRLVRAITKKDQMSEDTGTVEVKNISKRYSPEAKAEVVEFLKSQAIEKDGKLIITRGAHKQAFAKYGMTYLTQIKAFRKVYPNV